MPAQNEDLLDRAEAKIQKIQRQVIRKKC